MKLYTGSAAPTSIDYIARITAVLAVALVAMFLLWAPTPASAQSYPQAISTLPDTNPATVACNISPSLTAALSGQPAGEYLMNANGLSLVWSGTRILKSHRTSASTPGVAPVLSTRIFNPQCPTG